MANEQNLIPNSQRTPSELRAITSKGGKKSGEVRRRRKAMKEQMEMLLSLPVKNLEDVKTLKKLGVEESNIDNQMLLMLAMFEEAKTGDVQALKEIRSIVKDAESVSDNDRVQIINDLPRDDEDD